MNVFCCKWSVMNRSVLNGHHLNTDLYKYPFKKYVHENVSLQRESLYRSILFQENILFLIFNTVYAAF